jgi:hypothetical protein
MAEYSPPTEDLPIFDKSVFVNEDDFITLGYANTHYVRFPNAQGTENLQTTNVNGVLTTNSDVVFSPSTDIKWDRADANYLINDTLPKTITTGINNIALGTFALPAITSGNQNIGIGKRSLETMQTGSDNVCLGGASLQYTTDGEFNVCVGIATLRDHLSPDRNVCIGYQSNMTTLVGNNNTAVGYQTSSGGFSDSVALGYQATNTASNQVRLGRATETVSCPGDVSIEGDLILAPATQVQWNPTNRNYIINEDLPKSITTGIDNVAMGRHSLHQVTTGDDNIGFGHQAGRHITTGSSNIVIGDLALSAVGSTNVFSNIAIGSNSLLASITSGGISAQGNVAVGFDSGKANTTGTHNVYLGRESGATSTIVSRSTALGFQADCANFDDSTAVGAQTVCTASNQIRLGKSNQTVSCPGTLTFKMASDNNNGTFYIPFSKVAGGTEGALFVDDVTGPLTYNPSTSTMTMGTLSLSSGGVTTTYRNNCINTVPASPNIFFSSRTTAPSSGANNVVIGSNAGNSLTSGNNNVIMGSNAGAAFTSGSGNFAFGAGSLQLNTTGIENVAIGYSSMNASTGGAGKNTCIGSNSGNAISTTADGYNVCIGFDSGKLISTGSSNTCVGYNANNVAGNTTLINSTAIGSNTNNANFNSSTAIGAGATNTSANQIMLGTASETVSCPGSLTFKMTSDNSSGTYYIPFSKTTAGTEGGLFVDDTTGPLSYDPSTSSLTCAYTALFQGIVNTNSTSKNYFWTDRTTRPSGGNNVAIGFNAARDLTGGTESICLGTEAGKAATSGGQNVYIGHQTSTNSNATNCITIGYRANQNNVHGNNCVAIGNTASCSTFNTCVALGSGATCTANNQIRLGTSAQTVSCPGPTIMDGLLSTSITSAPSSARHLGYTVNQSTAGWTTSLTSNTQTNITSVSFTSVDYGTYLFEAKIQITPVDNTVARQQILGISLASANYGNNTDIDYTTANVGHPMLSVSRVLNIYSNTTVYLVGYIAGTNGTVVTASSAGIFSYTRIA